MSLWTNHRVMEWLRTIDLAEYAPNLRGSAVHGALMVSYDYLIIVRTTCTSCNCNLLALISLHTHCRIDHNYCQLFERRLRILWQCNNGCRVYLIFHLFFSFSRPLSRVTNTKLITLVCDIQEYCSRSSFYSFYAQLLEFASELVFRTI